LKIKAKVFHFGPNQRGVIAGTEYLSDDHGSARKVIHPEAPESYKRAMRDGLKRLGCNPSRFIVKRNWVDGKSPTVSYGKALDCVDFIAFAELIQRLPANYGIARVLREAAKL